MSTIESVDDPRDDRADAARPYGLIGLAVSTFAILLIAAILVSLMAAAAFGIAVLAVGLTPALDLLVRLAPSGARNDQQLIDLDIVLGLALYAAVSAAVLMAARQRGGRRWRDLVAWRAWHPLRRARIFWVLLALTLAYSAGAETIITKWYPEAHDWTPHPVGLVWSGLFILLAAVFAPITEELIFRGWLYTSLRVSIGVPAAVLLTAVLFALAHWERTHLYAAAIFPVGLVLGVLREKTGSLVSAITFHALYNGLASVLLFTS